MPNIATNNGFKAIVTGEQREGKCEYCSTQTKKEFYMDGTRKRVRMVCPLCGGQGRLIARTYAINAPHLKSFSFKDIREFIIANEYCAILSAYHTERVEYATKHRHKYMPDKYRTGEPSPQNIKQSIKAIIGLKLEKIRR